MAAYPITLAFAGPLAGYWSDRYSSHRLMRIMMVVINKRTYKSA